MGNILEKVYKKGQDVLSSNPDTASATASQKDQKDDESIAETLQEFPLAATHEGEVIMDVHSPLEPSSPTTGKYRRFIKPDEGSKPLVVVKFSGLDCQGSTDMIRPFHCLRIQFPNVVFIEANVEFNRHAVQRYNITGTPTFLACAVLCSKTRLRYY